MVIGLSSDGTIRLKDAVRPVRPFRAKPEIRVPLGLEAPSRLPDFSSVAVDLELGCGTGMFAQSYASNNSGRHLIAIERTVNKFTTFSRSYAAQPQGNLTPVHADAALWVDRYVPSNCIERLFVLYPNPYPKRKQRNLRWHYMPAMHSILRTLKPGGSLMFCTNLRWLVEEAAAQFVGGWGLELVSLEQVSQGDRLPLTRFEKKYLERGQPCFELKLQMSAALGN